jgi:membrane protease YdiL (CAAX protease family)
MNNTILSYIKKHAVLSYFILTISISWGTVLIIIGGLRNFPGSEQQIDALLPLVVVGLAIGPVSSGLLITGLLYGKKGLADFFARLIKWRVNIKWYIVAILAAPVVAAISLAGLSTISPIYIPGIVSASGKMNLIILALLTGIVAGLFEEPGWTGFATPRMREKYSLVKSGLLIGILWGVWHFIVMYWGSGTPSGEFSWLIMLPQLGFYVLVLPAFRIIMTWVYDHTQSLFISILMHGCLSGGILYIFMPENLEKLPLLIWYAVLAVIFWVIVFWITKSQKSTL